MKKEKDKRKRLILIIILLIIFILVGYFIYKSINKVDNNTNINETNDNYSISGYLYDEDGMPIKNAKLFVYSDSPKTTKTDNRGYFYIDGLEKGEHEVYYVKDENVDISDKDNVVSKSSLKINLSTDNNDVKYSDEDYDSNLNIVNNIDNNKYNITLNPNGGSIDTTTYCVIRNSYYGDLPIPKKSGYTFIGWYYNDEEILNDTYVFLDSAHILKARYKANEYTISYNTNGGNLNTKNKTVTFEEKYGNLSIPTRSGYKFIGWYYNDELITKDSIVNISSDHELIAKWEKIVKSKEIKKEEKNTEEVKEDKPEEVEELTISLTK